MRRLTTWLIFLKCNSAVVVLSIDIWYGERLTDQIACLVAAIVLEGIVHLHGAMDTLPDWCGGKATPCIVGGVGERLWRGALALAFGCSRIGTEVLEEGGELSLEWSGGLRLGA